jgi:hypothetical protein
MSLVDRVVEEKKNLGKSIFDRELFSPPGSCFCDRVIKCDVDD